MLFSNIFVLICVTCKDCSAIKAYSVQVHEYCTYLFYYLLHRVELKIIMEVSVNNLIPGSTPAFLAYFLILQKNTQEKKLG